MKITDIPVAVLRVQYQFARFPLQVIGDHVFGRVAEEAPARLFYERSVGMLDATVGAALRDSDLQRRGTAEVARTEDLRRAAQLDAKATGTLRQANSELTSTQNKAQQERTAAQEKAGREVKQARNNAQESKRDAVEAAQKNVAAGKKQADEVAARRAEAVESAKRDTRSAIRAEETQAKQAAAAKLDDAAAKRAAATAERAEADRVEDLADAEKRKRQARR